MTTELRLQARRMAEQVKDAEYLTRRDNIAHLTQVVECSLDDQAVDFATAVLFELIELGIVIE